MRTKGYTFHTTPNPVTFRESADRKHIVIEMGAMKAHLDYQDYQELKDIIGNNYGRGELKVDRPPVEKEEPEPTEDETPDQALVGAAHE